MNQTILRNLFYTLKRFRTASALNLFGLSFAFAAFIVIMMKVNYERGLQVPGFEYGTIYAPAWGKTALYTDPKNPQYFYETPWAVSPGFAKVVGLKFIAGSDAEMGQPESIIVSESYARKLFPDGNALTS